MANYPFARFVLPAVYAPSPTGAPIPGSTLSFFQTGTSTPQNTYADPALQVPNPNPVVADKNGLFPDIFLQPLNYRVVWADQNGNQLRVWDPVAPFVASAFSRVVTVALECVVDGNNATPNALNPNGCADLYIPFACIIQSAVLQADQPGNLSMDVWVNPFQVNTPPTATNSIVASDFPSLVSSQSSIDTTLSGWTTLIAAGSAMRFFIKQVDTLFRFTLTLTASVVVPTS